MPVARVKLDRRPCGTAKLRCYKNILSTQPIYREVVQKVVESGRGSDPVAERRFYYAVTHLCVLRVFSVSSRRVRFRFTPFTTTRSTSLEYMCNSRAIKEWEIHAGGTCTMYFRESLVDLHGIRDTRTSA